MPSPIQDVASGLFSIGATYAGRKDRQANYANSEAEFNRTKAEYQNLDTSNQYANQQNAFEDLTVNTAQADYVSDQQKQAMASTMGNMQGAAGGSGIAALSQAMAGQQSQNLQQASASIGMQEANNANQKASGAMAIQAADRRGMTLSQTEKRGQAGDELMMGQQAFSGAKDERAAATQAYGDAAGQILGGVGNQITGMPNFAGANPFVNTMFGG